MRFLPFVAGSMMFVVFDGTLIAAEPVTPAADARGVVAAAPQNAARPLRGAGASQIGANGAPIVLEVNKGTLIRLTARRRRSSSPIPISPTSRSSRLR